MKFFLLASLLPLLTAAGFRPETGDRLTPEQDAGRIALIQRMAALKSQASLEQQRRDDKNAKKIEEFRSSEKSIAHLLSLHHALPAGAQEPPHQAVEAESQRTLERHDAELSRLTELLEAHRGKENELAATSLPTGVWLARRRELLQDGMRVDADLESMEKEDLLALVAIVKMFLDHGVSKKDVPMENI